MYLMWISFKELLFGALFTSEFNRIKSLESRCRGLELTCSSLSLTANTLKKERNELVLSPTSKDSRDIRQNVRTLQVIGAD